MRLISPALVVFLLTWSASTVGRADENKIPRPEHPRPDAARPHWANLNGTWQFRFDPKDEGVKQGWPQPGVAGFDRSIVVPFGWESELSGIRELKGPKVAWYRREFTVPADFPKTDRVVLHFGAVDWRADVWVNGKKVAEHEGGYSPFSVDVTDSVTQGKAATLVVRAFDPTDPELPTGKQVGWYTPTSGIWQTVWLESHPKAHLADFTIRTDLVSASIDLEPAGLSKGTYEVSAKVDDPAVSVEPFTIHVEDPGKPVKATLKAVVKMPKLWTPETPHIYDLTVSLKGPDGSTDEVRTYFGLRTITRGKYGDDPNERLLLNGKPVYLRAALDQSFNPKGIYTAPDDDFLKRDLVLAKYLGLNGLRIHIKPDEPRRLYWADKIGLLILEDMPNTWRQSPKARSAWEATMREVVARDKNHPSIVVWVAFNETWGLANGSENYKTDLDTQSWVKRMVAAIRKLDPTRLVEDNSPCNYDHVAGSDLNSWHFYIDDHAPARTHIADVVARTSPGSKFNFCPGEVQGTAPLINSEYGSVGAGDGDRDVSWGFRDLTTQLRKHPKIQGYVYTELTDIEWEHNGFADYDRQLKDFGYHDFLPDMDPSELNGADFVGYDAPPAIVGKPGEVVTVPVFVSHFSDRAFSPFLRYWVDGFDDSGDTFVVLAPKSVPARWTPFGVTWQDSIQVKLPNRPFVGALNLTLRDPANHRFAANFVNLVVKEDAPRAERSVDDDRDALLRFSPNDYAKAKWSGPVAGHLGKVSGRGKGSFEYRIKVPQAIAKAGVESLFMRFELGARSGADQVDWPSRTTSKDTPQTDKRKHPTTFEITLNGRKALREDLGDDPADARGVLSHLAKVEHGSHGYLVEAHLTVEPDEAKAIAAGQPLILRLTVPDDAEHPGGLSIYGADAGKYPFDPVIHVRTKAAMPADLGIPPRDPVTVDSIQSKTTLVLPPGDALVVKPAVWAYSTAEEAPVDWNAPAFDDSAWKRGAAGFGTSDTPSIQVHTPWNTPTIRLRSKFQMPKPTTGDVVILHLFHDEDVEIFVNGKRLAQASGFSTAYEDRPLSAEARALLVEGENTIAVICRQTRGGQGIDLGLIVRPTE